MANGKGSGRRPAAVGDSHIASEWDRIFSPEVICPGCHHCQPATGPLPLQRPAQPPPVSPGWPAPQFINSHIAPEDETA